MSRKTSQARHRADVSTSAFKGLSRAVKASAVSVGRPVAVAAVTSGLALAAMGTANAGEYTDAPVAPAPVAAPVVAAPAPVAAVVVAPVTAVTTSHTVAPGDTLGAISATYGADLHALLAVNGLSLASVIYPGDVIALPTADVVVAAAPVVVAPAAPVETVAVPVETFAAPAQVEAPAQHAAAAAPAANDGVYLAAANVTPAPVETRQAAPAAVGNVAGALVASAYGQIGITQDCTAMVENALRSAGIPVGDLGPSQFFQFGSTVGTPAPGDIVITAGHVAIYVGDGQVISGGMNGINSTMKHPLSDLPGASFVRVAG